MSMEWVGSMDDSMLQHGRWQPGDVHACMSMTCHPTFPTREGGRRWNDPGVLSARPYARPRTFFTFPMQEQALTAEVDPPFSKIARGQTVRRPLSENGPPRRSGPPVPFRTSLHAREDFFHVPPGQSTKKVDPPSGNRPPKAERSSARGVCMPGQR